MHAVLQIVESYGSSIDAESVKLMRYAEAAIKEAMRVQPVVPIAPRVALKSFDVCGYTVPKVCCTPSGAEKL